MALSSQQVQSQSSGPLPCAGQSAVPASRAGSRPRLIWVDYAKVLGIYLVVFGHLPLASAGLNNYLATLRMPLFFMLSGLFEKKGSFRSSLKTSAERLMWPYFVFYILAWLWTIFETFVLKIPYYPNPTFFEVVQKPLLGMIIGTANNMTYSTIINGPLWFLFALFWIKILFAACGAVGKGRDWFIYMMQIPVAIGGWLLCRTGKFIWFSFESALMAMPFYVFGYWLKECGIVEKLYKTKFMPLMLAAAAALSWLCFAANGTAFIASGIYGRSYMLFLLSGISGSLMAIFLLRMLPQKRLGIIETISKGTLVIVGLHLHLSGLLINIMKNIFWPDFSSFSDWQALLFSLIILLVCYWPIELTEKKAQWVLGRFGCRI